MTDVSTNGVTNTDIERLRRMTWAQLQKKALNSGVSLGKVRSAATRDELRQAILLAQGQRPEL